MPGTPLNLPKWLLLLLVVGVFAGQWHQVECRTSEHQSVTANVVHADVVLQGSGHDVDPGTDVDGGCPFNCLFSASVPCGLTPCALPARAVFVMALSPRPEAAPESRRDAIDHPPQLA